MPDPVISVLLVDDHPLVLAGLRDLIGRESSLVLIEPASDMVEARERFEGFCPDVVVLDIYLGKELAIDFIPELRRAGRTEVLMLSVSVDVALIDRGLRAGARGFVGKAERPHRVIEGIQAVAQGFTFLPEGMPEQILRLWRSGRPGCPCAGLTPRESEIFGKLGEGLASPEIASSLGLSIKTVEAHKENLKRKLGLPTASQLRQRAILEKDQAVRSSGELGGFTEKK